MNWLSLHCKGAVSAETIAQLGPGWTSRRIHCSHVQIAWLRSSKTIEHGGFKSLCARQLHGDMWGTLGGTVVDRVSAERRCTAAVYTGADECLQSTSQNESRMDPRMLDA